MCVQKLSQCPDSASHGHGDLATRPWRPSSLPSLGQVFVQSNLTAIYVAALLDVLAKKEARPFAVARVAGLPKMTAAERKRVINQWDEACSAGGAGGCLVNVQAIATGFNMPSISDVFIGRAGALRDACRCFGGYVVGTHSA